MPRIFVAQALIDEWIGAGRVQLDGEVLRINAGGVPLNMSIHPAVHFERIDGADTDPYNVVGAVKSAEELAQMGAEHYQTSVVLGDYAYTVCPGFTAVAIGPDGSEAQLDGATWGQLVGTLSAMAPGV